MIADFLRHSLVTALIRPPACLFMPTPFHVVNSTCHQLRLMSSLFTAAFDYFFAIIFFISRFDIVTAYFRFS